MSTSYPTAEGTCLADLPHGVVATRKLDDTVEYLHVVKAPSGKELSLPPPADGKCFLSATLLKKSHPLKLVQDASGVQLTLPDDDSWDALNTVIKIQVDPATIPPVDLALHRPVIASSSIEKEPPWPPRSDWGRIRLVDGQRHITSKPAKWSTGNSGWSSVRLKDNHEEHVGVDLGTAFEVDGVRLYPRDDGANAGYGFPVDFEVQISGDGKDWKTVLSRTDCPLPKGVQSYSFPPQRAGFVRVVASRLRANPNDGNLYAMQLAEMEISGRPLGGGR